MGYGEAMFHKYASLTLHPHGHPYESSESNEGRLDAFGFRPLDLMRFLIAYVFLCRSTY
ncbi:hypothetical protein BDZ89DRAFT_1066353, partial [Hymenopellis radicata]